MRTEVARSIPAAVLAALVLATCAPDPTLVAGAPHTASATPSPQASPSASDLPDDGSDRPASAAVDPVGPTASASTPDRPTDRPMASQRRAPEGVEPRRVRIPAIGVDANVGEMGLNDDGSIEVPEAFEDTGWWSYSPRPGHVGASAILGHVDSRSGPAVFFRLTELRPGDQIHVDGTDGRTVTFAVRAIEQHPKASFPSEKVFGATPHPSLRLVTCGGAFDSNAGSHLDNVIVFADRVSA